MSFRKMGAAANSSMELWVLSPSQTQQHQTIAARLMVALDDCAPSDVVVTQGVEVRISRRRSLIPDVLAVDESVAVGDPAHYPAAGVILAVEIVSSRSVSMDRILKPALYAQAGIPHFWRIESNSDLAIHAYRLAPDGDVYLAAGTYTDVLATTEPWPMRIELTALRARKR